MAAGTIWGSFVKTARVGTGDGDWPLIEPDIYNGEIIEVSEPTDEPNRFKPGEMQTRFWVNWKLTDQETNEEVGTLRQYLNLPNGYIESGVLSDKSGLYQFMKGLGLIEDDEDFTVDPPAWVGLKGRCTVERYETQDGRERDRITKVMPPRRARAAAPAPARLPGRTSSRSTAVADEDEEDADL